MQSVSTFYKEERDFLYRKGKELGQKLGQELGQKLGEQTGRAEKARAVVENLLTKTSFSDEDAADIAEVSLEFVQQVKAELGSKK